MIRQYVKIAATSLFIVVLATGCKKDVLDTDTYVAVDNAIADGAFQDMMAVVNQQAATGGLSGFAPVDGLGKTMDDCPTTTFSAPIGVFPNTMTVDFGTGCAGYLGVERSGKIMATFTGPYVTEGTVITITTDNYYVNGSKVEGVKTLTNQGLTGAGNPVFLVAVSDGKITLASGEIITWNSTRTREWQEGDETLEIADDVYALSDGPGATYAVEGVNRNGVNFTAHIASALIKRMDCRYITTGILEITPEGMLTRELDFGSGDCDNDATLTIGEFTTPITLLY